MTIWQHHKIRHFLIDMVKNVSKMTSLPRVDRRFKELGMVQWEQKDDPWIAPIFME